MVGVVHVRIKPKTTRVRIFPDAAKVQRVMQERPHMREKLTAMLRDGVDVLITVRPKD